MFQLPEAEDSERNFDLPHAVATLSKWYTMKFLHKYTPQFSPPKFSKAEQRNPCSFQVISDPRLKKR